MRTRLVWAALSGGVDSAVAAASLCEKGMQVVGVTLALREGDEAAIAKAAAAASQLGIEHRLIDAREAFDETVVRPFVAGYAAGTTPNPCVVCNEKIKFGVLLEHARRAGADLLVTGHYARVVSTEGGLRIARALDAAKDQSYFLYRLCQDALSMVEFPLGEMPKASVRELAARMGLHAAQETESQDVCFLGRTSAGEFVAQHEPDADRPGPILDMDGVVIGTHGGLCRYTVGQRKGLPGGAGPRFVAALDPERNAVIAGPRDACQTTRFDAADAVWHAPEEVEAFVCVRARSAPVPGRVVRRGDILMIEVQKPVCAAPGQSAVCYQGDVVLGGGIITKEALP